MRPIWLTHAQHLSSARVSAILFYSCHYFKRLPQRINICGRINSSTKSYKLFICKKIRLRNFGCVRTSIVLLTISHINAIRRGQVFIRVLTVNMHTNHNCMRRYLQIKRLLYKHELPEQYSVLSFKNFTLTFLSQSSKKYLGNYFLLAPLIHLIEEP